MDQFPTENLVLLEFLVDQINLDFQVQKDTGRIMGETCVSFQFLDNVPLEICEQDFSNKSANLGADQNVKSGKSCLFSLSPQQGMVASQVFDIYVEIFKKMQSGILPDKIPVGTSLVSVAELFNELIKTITTTGETPAAKTLKDCYKVTNTQGDNVGHISVYIRMSCFGKLIVTQFQMNLEDKSVQFKAKEGHYLFRYNKGKSKDGGKQERPNPCADFQKSKQLSYNAKCPEISCEDAKQPPASTQSFQCPYPPSSSQSPYGFPQQQIPMQPQMGQWGMPPMMQMPQQMMQGGYSGAGGYPGMGNSGPGYPQGYGMPSKFDPCANCPVKPRTPLYPPGGNMQQQYPSSPYTFNMPPAPCSPAANAAANCKKEQSNGDKPVNTDGGEASGAKEKVAGGKGGKGKGKKGKKK